MDSAVGRGQTQTPLPEATMRDLVPDPIHRALVTRALAVSLLQACRANASTTSRQWFRVATAKVDDAGTWGPNAAPDVG